MSSLFRSVTQMFTGGGTKSSSAPAAPVTAPLAPPVAAAAAQTVLLQKKQGRTSTKFGGLLGMSQQADTAKKTLLGQ